MMKLKRIISTVLATVMAASVLSIGMVSVASATEHENGTVELNGAKTEKTWGFTSNIPTNDNIKLADGDTIWGITYNAGTDAGVGNLNKGQYLNLKTGTTDLTAGNTLTIPVPANSTGSINVIFQSDSNKDTDKRTLTFQDGEKKELVMQKAGSTADFTATATSEGKLVLTAEATNAGVVESSAKDVKISSIKITLTSGEFPALVFAEDSLTALADQTTLAGNELDSNSNFIVDGGTVADTTIKVDGGGFVEFKVNANALLTVDFKSGSSTLANTATVKLSKLEGKAAFSAGDPIVDGSSFGAPGNGAQYRLIYKLADEGIYKLDCVSEKSTVQIESFSIKYNTDPDPDSEVQTTKATATEGVGCIRSGDTYYVVSVVSKDAAEAATGDLTQTANSGSETIGSSGTVYKQLSLNGTTYNPTDLMDSADNDNYYVFASAIDASTGVDQIKSIPEPIVKLITTNIATGFAAAA